MSNKKTPKAIAREVVAEENNTFTSDTAKALTKVSKKAIERNHREELKQVSLETRKLIDNGSYEDIFYSEADAKKLGTPTSAHSVNFQKYHFIVGRSTRVAKPHVEAIKKWLGRLPSDKGTVILPGEATEDLKTNV